MSSESTGLLDCEIAATPVAVIDFETTGMSAGIDRVVEVAVVRIDPGRRPRLVLDTLVHPGRRVSASEIHGITDRDVRDAPFFEELADPFLEAIGGCVVGAYNVYFDIKFLEFELRRVRRPCLAPHLCLMYLRPMLGVGERCSLDRACTFHGIRLGHAHRAAADALAAARLWEICAGQLAARGIRTFGELGALKAYKFVESFGRAPLRPPASFKAGAAGVHLKPRV